MVDSVCSRKRSRKIRREEGYQTTTTTTTTAIMPSTPALQRHILSNLHLSHTMISSSSSSSRSNSWHRTNVLAKKLLPDEKRKNCPLYRFLQVLTLQVVPRTDFHPPKPRLSVLLMSSKAFREITRSLFKRTFSHLMMRMHLHSNAQITLIQFKAFI